MNNQEIFKSPESFRAELSRVAEAGKPHSSVTPASHNTSSPTIVDNPVIDLNTSPVVSADSLVDNDVKHDHDNKHEVEAESKSDLHNSNPNDTNQHLIPKSRFNQEIKRREELETKLQAEREKAIRAEARADELAKIAQYKLVQPSVEQKVPEVIPLDQEAHNYYQKKISELESKVNNVANATVQETQKIYQLSTLGAQEAAFKEKHPDYVDALKYIRDVELNTAKEFISDEAKAQEFVTRKLQDMASLAMNTGKNTPEMVYKIAQNYGFKPQNASNSNEGYLYKPTHSGPNIDAINKNAPKSANINHVGSSANIGGAGNLNIEAALVKSNHGTYVDPKAFQALLTKVREREHR